MLNGRRVGSEYRSAKVLLWRPERQRLSRCKEHVVRCRLQSGRTDVVRSDSSADGVSSKKKVNAAFLVELGLQRARARQAIERLPAPGRRTAAAINRTPTVTASVSRSEDLRTYSAMAAWSDASTCPYHPIALPAVKYRNREHGHHRRRPHSPSAPRPLPSWCAPTFR